MSTRIHSDEMDPRRQSARHADRPHARRRDVPGREARPPPRLARPCARQADVCMCACACIRTCPPAVHSARSMCILRKMELLHIWFSALKPCASREESARSDGSTCVGRYAHVRRRWRVKDTRVLSASRATGPPAAAPPSADARVACSEPPITAAGTGEADGDCGTRIIACSPYRSQRTRAPCLSLAALRVVGRARGRARNAIPSLVRPATGEHHWCCTRQVVMVTREAERESEAERQGRGRGRAVGHGHHQFVNTTFTIARTILDTRTGPERVGWGGE